MDTVKPDNSHAALDVCSAYTMVASPRFASWVNLPTELRRMIISFAVRYDDPIEVRRPRSNKRGCINPANPGPLFGLPEGIRQLAIQAGWEKEALVEFLQSNTFDLRSWCDLHWAKRSLLHTSPTEKPILLEHHVRALICHVHGGYRPWTKNPKNGVQRPAFPLSQPARHLFTDRDADAFLEFFRNCTKLEHLTWVPEGLRPIGNKESGPYAASTQMYFVLYEIKLGKATYLEGLKSFRLVPGRLASPFCRPTFSNCEKSLQMKLVK